MPRPSPQTNRVVTILNLLTHRAGHGATLTEIAQQVGQTPAACVHVLAALADAGFVVRTPSDRRYHVGPALIAPGRVAASRFPDLAATRAAMEDLSAAIGFAVCAYRRDDTAYSRLVEVVADPQSPVRWMRIGDLLPIEAPVGAVFVAWSGPEEVEGWLREFRRDPDTCDALRALLLRGRRQGFILELHPQPPLHREFSRLLARGRDLRRAERIRGSVPGADRYIAGRIRTDEEYEAVNLSVPVPSPGGRVDLALAVTGFDSTISGRDLLEVAKHTRAAARRLVRELARTPADP